MWAVIQWADGVVDAREIPAHSSYISLRRFPVGGRVSGLLRISDSTYVEDTSVEVEDGIVFQRRGGLLS